MVATPKSVEDILNQECEQGFVVSVIWMVIVGY